MTPARGSATLPHVAPSGAAERAVDRSEAWQLLGLLAQGIGVLALIVGLQIENAAFYGRIAPLAIGGAVVNHLLPARYRLGFFALLSVTGMWLVFGIEQGTWILGIGMGFIALCHLPVRRAVRVGLLLTAAAGLATMRAGWVGAPWSNTIWPVVGSMLMFRLIVYMYDLPHLKERTTWEQRIAYFFCLPNVVFPLFPVLDFATFRRTYYDRPAPQIYQEGITWILRGLLHLVAYRLVYQFGTRSPADVSNGTDLVIYVVANYALYLRVSGQFHVIAGVLHLFGFRLPETHRFFFLASSFSDLWRRINVYWKDFMQKVFYLPSFLRIMRRHGETAAMVVSTLLVFAVTWFFHSYQWFWLLGSWLWSTTDTLFWALLGVCLIVNSLYEARAGRTRSLGVPTLTPSRLLRHGAQTAAMYTVMCLLWALWTSPTMGAFADLLGSAHFRPRDGAVVLLVWVTVGALAALLYRRAHAAAGKGSAGSWSPAVLAAGLAIVPLSDMAAVRPHIPERARKVFASARNLQLNKRDQDQLQRGYYEQIVGVNRFNNELWKVYSLRPTDWVRLDSTGAVRLTDDDRLEELVPGFSEKFHGAQLTISSAGLRDREYPLAKEDGVFRAVVMGQSYVLGEGVNDRQTFENVLEDRLNAGDARTLGHTRVELLNFGGPAYSAMQQRADLVVGRVQQWNPDMVLVVGHFRELAQLDDYFRSFLRQRDPSLLPDEIRPWVDSSGVTATMTAVEAERRLKPYAERILSFAYADLVARIRALGATPVFAYIPTPDVRVDPALLETYLATTRDAGFEATFDLRNVYDGGPESRFNLTEWDHHPNVAGHVRIAERLREVLLASPELLRRRSAGAP